MKRVLLLIALTYSFTSSAQSLTQTNEPAIGESQSMFLCDSFAATYEGTTGAGVTWDYSALTKYAGQERDVVIEDATLSPFATEFPSSVKTIRVENSLTTFFNSTATERVSQGFVFSEPSFGDVVATFSTDEEKLVEYPFANGSSLSDTYGGDLDFSFNGIPTTAVASGSAYAWIDGEGTLLYPNGTSATGVIRYKMIDTSLTNIMLFGDLEIVRTQYEYYDLAAGNLPVLTLSRILIQQPGGGIALADNSIVLSLVEPTNTNTSSVNENDLVQFSVYPNPTSDNITVSGEFDSNAIATLYDQSGRVVSTQSATDGMSIDLSNVNTGMYLLKVTNNGTSTTKTVVKR